MLAAFCFYKFGILPKEYLKLERRDKALMYASIDYFSKQESKKAKGNKGRLV